MRATAIGAALRTVADRYRGQPVAGVLVLTDGNATDLPDGKLDVAGLRTRIEVYKHAGYFEPDQAEEIKAQAARSDVSWAPAILRGFVRRYGQRLPARAQAG